MSDLRQLNIKYAVLWLFDLMFRVAIPLIIVGLRFGIFKQTASLNAWFVIGVIIAVSIVKNDIVDVFKELENKGWYRAYKNVFWLTIMILIVLVSKIMANHMLYVLIAFLIGALTSLYFEPKKASNRLRYDKIKKEL